MANYYIPPSFKRWIVQNYGQDVFDANKGSLEQSGKALPQFQWLTDSAQGKLVGEGAAKRDYLSKQIGAPGSVDEATLNDQELSDRLGAYKELQTIPDQQNFYNRDRYVNDVAGIIKQRIQDQKHSPPSDDVLRKAADYLFSTTQGENWDPYRFTQILGNGKGDSSQVNFANDIQRDVFPRTNQYLQSTTTTPDYSTDIGRVQDIINTRAGQTNAQAKVDELTNSLPGELVRGRQDLFAGQAADASRYFNENLAPTVMAGLNSRGILYSGDLESELSRAGGDVQASLESAQAQQIASDDDFFRNAAYQQTFQKEIQAGQNLSGEVATARNTAFQNQGFNFNNIQANLSRRYSDLVNQRQNESALIAQQAQAQRQRDLLEQQTTANAINTIASGVTSVGSAYIGNKAASSGGTTGTNNRGVT